MGPYTNNTVKNKHNVNMYMDALDYSTVSISGYQNGFISN